MKKLLLTFLLSIFTLALFSQTDTLCNEISDDGYVMIKTNISGNKYIISKTDERGNERIYPYDIENRLHGTSYFSDCKGNLLSVTNYKHGLKHGKWEFYYSNGQLATLAFYRNDKKSGTWKYYNEEGNLLKEEKF